MWVRITNGPPPPSWALLIEITPSGLSVSPRVAQANCRVSSYPHNPFPCPPLPLGPAHHPSRLAPAAASSWPLVSSISLLSTQPFPCPPLPLGPAHHPSLLAPAAASSWPLVSSLSLVLSPIGPRSLSCPPCPQAQPTPAVPGPTCS